MLTREVLNRKMKKFESKGEIARMEKLFEQKLKLAQDAFDYELSNISKKNR